MNCKIEVNSLTFIVIASIWFLIVTGVSTFVAIMFCYRLGQFLDSDITSKSDCKSSSYFFKIIIVK